MPVKKICPFCDNKEAYRFIDVGKFTKLIYPKNPAISYHVLIVPRRHVARLDQLSRQEWEEIRDYIRLLNNACETRLSNYIGYNALSNNGDERINQRVPHCHVHLFLRTTDNLSSPIIGKHIKPADLTSRQLMHMEELKGLIDRC